MKKLYNKPEIEIIELGNQDIITASKQFGDSLDFDTMFDFDDFDL